MRKETEQVLTIASLERLKLSTNGNPRFRVTFTNGLVAQTQTDSSVGYSIESPEYRDVPVVVSFTKAGRIFGVVVAPQAAPKCSTIGCTDPATHVLTWSMGADPAESENVCEPCGDSYASRPALRATLKPLGA